MLVSTGYVISSPSAGNVSGQEYQGIFFGVVGLLDAEPALLVLFSFEQ
jgi:hypothetical protein